MNASRMHSENEAQRAATTPVTSNDATAVGARGQAAALGVDIGAVAIKLVLIDSQGQRLGHWQRPLQGRPAELLATMLADEELLSLCADAALRIGVTGAGRNAVNGPLGRVNEIVAFSKGIAKLVPTARAAIEVGGHSARWVTLEDARGSLEDYGQNQLCAAGSGVFLEQQGSRLRIGIEEFSRLAENAPKGATIAGRCSVFAKSDMIHLQQKGTPPEEIAYGLCLAMARNFLATVLKGRELHPPIILAGGGAANGGLLRAFREVFHFSEHELLRSPLPAFETALGAAHLALSDSKLAPVQGSVLAEQLQFLDNATELSMLAPLEVKPRTPGQTVLPPEKVRAFLGIDVGSVSTNFVLTGP
ncbi:MAG: acyl-CoA dehydratase activase, partial [Myxococcota bacterium]|nr:acyl-CoA dehydratase activase [Myxococcota bacterium]